MGLQLALSLDTADKKVNQMIWHHQLKKGGNKASRHREWGVGGKSDAGMPHTGSLTVTFKNTK